MLYVIIIFCLITIFTAVIITLIQKIFAVKEDPIAEKIDKLLPQTQCGQCGYPGCMPYANAVANGDEINKCIPGGQELVVQLSELLNRPIPEGELETPEDKIAIIDEDVCIGCLHCIEACPVDAIIGAKKLMHVIIPDYCTGCELCLDPCPVKCISMIDRPQELNKFSLMRKEANLPKHVTIESLIKINNVAVTSANLNSQQEQANPANSEAEITTKLADTSLESSPTQGCGSKTKPSLISKTNIINLNQFNPNLNLSQIDDKSYSSKLVARLAKKLQETNLDPRA